jgi:predicted pyridoxine 5'-phosphate oxidase superfamily flavin-nucleotide-binding protein
MVKLPETVSKAWEEKEGPVVLATIDKHGIPNIIYVTCVSKYNDETIIVANNYFNKTLENIFSGSKGSILFITKERKSYQIKGSLEYHREGAIFEDMKCWNPEKHPSHAAVALKVEEVYTGSQKLV